MREEESRNRMRRIYARKKLANDPVAWATFDALIQAMRNIIGEPDGVPGWHVLAEAAHIAADLEENVTDHK